MTFRDDMTEVAFVAVYLSLNVLPHCGDSLGLHHRSGYTHRYYNANFLRVSFLENVIAKYSWSVPFMNRTFVGILSLSKDNDSTRIHLGRKYRVLRIALCR